MGITKKFIKRGMRRVKPPPKPRKPVSQAKPRRVSKYRAW